MIRTVFLTGEEQKVEGIEGFHTRVKNFSNNAVYVSRYPDIVPDADNVLEIPAWSSDVISSTNGTAYLLGTGTGKVQLRGQDDYTGEDNSSPQSEGNDDSWEIKKAYIDMCDGINLEAARSYTDAVKEDIEQKLAAASNPNLLDNWYFVSPINQRGVSGTVSDTGYFIDRWKLTDGSVTISSGGLVLNGTIEQILETAPEQTVTASYLTGSGVQPAEYNRAQKKVSITASNELIIASKLELGDHQTLARPENGKCVLNDPPPNKALELKKCQRYQIVGKMHGIKVFQKGPKYAGFLFSLPTPLRKNPTFVGDLLINRITVDDYGTPTKEIVSWAIRSNGVYVYASVPTEQQTNDNEAPLLANILEGCLLDANL